MPPSGTSPSSGKRHPILGSLFAQGVEDAFQEMFREVEAAAACSERGETHFTFAEMLSVMPPQFDEERLRDVFDCVASEGRGDDTICWREVFDYALSASSTVSVRAFLRRHARGSGERGGADPERIDMGELTRAARELGVTGLQAGSLFARCLHDDGYVDLSDARAEMRRMMGSHEMRIFVTALMLCAAEERDVDTSSWSFGGYDRLSCATNLSGMLRWRRVSCTRIFRALAADLEMDGRSKALKHLHLDLRGFKRGMIDKLGFRGDSQVPRVIFEQISRCGRSGVELVSFDDFKTWLDGHLPELTEEEKASRARAAPKQSSITDAVKDALGRAQTEKRDDSANKKWDKERLRRELLSSMVRGRVPPAVFVAEFDKNGDGALSRMAFLSSVRSVLLPSKGETGASWLPSGHEAREKLWHVNIRLAASEAFDAISGDDGSTSVVEVTEWIDPEGTTFTSDHLLQQQQRQAEAARAKTALKVVSAGAGAASSSTVSPRTMPRTKALGHSPRPNRDVRSPRLTTSAPMYTSRHPRWLEEMLRERQRVGGGGGGGGGTRISSPPVSMSPIVSPIMDLDRRSPRSARASCSVPMRSPLCTSLDLHRHPSSHPQKPWRTTSAAPRATWDLR
jgi:hypothetical protein